MTCLRSRRISPAPKSASRLRMGYEGGNGNSEGCLPCQKNNHCRAWLRSSSSLKPKTSFLSANLRRYRSSADVSMTGNGGDCVWSMITGILPLGSRRRNQSFFCSLVMILLDRKDVNKESCCWGKCLRSLGWVVGLGRART